MTVRSATLAGCAALLAVPASGQQPDAGWRTVPSLVLPAAAPTDLSHFDLAKVVERPRACWENGDGGDVVVCAPKNMDMMLDRSMLSHLSTPTRLTVPLGGVVSVKADQRSLPGASAPAAMVNLKWKF